MESYLEFELVRNDVEEDWFGDRFESADHQAAVPLADVDESVRIPGGWRREWVVR